MFQFTLGKNVRSLVVPKLVEDIEIKRGRYYVVGDINHLANSQVNSYRTQNVGLLPGQTMLIRQVQTISIRSN